jgi:hypothetical protein
MTGRVTGRDVVPEVMVGEGEPLGIGRLLNVFELPGWFVHAVAEIAINRTSAMSRSISELPDFFRFWVGWITFLAGSRATFVPPGNPHLSAIKMKEPVLSQRNLHELRTPGGTTVRLGKNGC